MYVILIGKNVQNSHLVSQTTDISVFHSKLASHKLVLKVLSVLKKALSLVPKWQTEADLP